MNVRTTLVCAAAWFGCLVAASCADNNPPALKMNMQITSSAFAESQPIPDQYTCSGADISPPLAWSGAPAGTRCFALIAEDPDAPGGTWAHWVIYNLPAATTALAQNVPRAAELSDGTRQGVNDFGKTGYGGPCPPPGKPHRYDFRIYALDGTLDLQPGATRRQLLKAMSGHILGEGELMGTYQRK